VPAVSVDEKRSGLTAVQTGRRLLDDARGSCAGEGLVDGEKWGKERKKKCGW